MQIFINTNYDFVGKIVYCLIVSVLVIIIGWTYLFIKGPAWGLDFSGGTLMVVKFANEPPLSKMRSVFTNATIQATGEKVANEVNIRIPQSSINLNGTSEKDLYDFIKTENPFKKTLKGDLSAKYKALAKEIISYRKEKGSIQQLEELRTMKGMDPALFEFFKKSTYCGKFGVAKVEEEASREFEERERGRLWNAIATQEQKDMLAKGLLDINATGKETLTKLLREKDPLQKGDTDEARQSYSNVVASIQAYKIEKGIIKNIDEIKNVPLMTEPLFAFLKQSTFCGPFNMLSTEYVGPVVGSELKKKATQAVIWALLGILVYVGFRFQYQWGIAGVIALFHDVLFTMGLQGIFRIEFTLTAIAAYLTLVGFSINDTIVVFDRIRENMNIMRREKFSDIVNTSVNQTLSRTILTSSTVFFVSLALFFFGGDVLKPLSFVLLIGIVVGTYSSVYIASPLLILWQNVKEGRKKKEKKS